MNCNFIKKDRHAQEFGDAESGAQNRMGIQKQKDIIRMGEQEVQRIMQKWQSVDQNLIIKMQARFRGYIARKKIKQEAEIVDPQPRLSNRSQRKKFLQLNKSQSNFRSNKELDAMPDYSNEVTREVEDKLGPFVYD